MTLKIDTHTLADKLGVPSVPFGMITHIQGKNADGVIKILREQGLKFLGFYERVPLPEPNVIYLNVDGQILGTKAQSPKVDTGCLPPKPEGYKDGHRLILYDI